ncbi:MAG: hypothetical protein M3Y05_09360 [Gemmatimonadota bacterium]|nr:hypothetical protein [Gemmatimonadota bacterium]
MSRLWLFISLPAAVVAVWLLVKTILSLIRSTRASVVATVSIRAEQQIIFDSAGAYVLNFEAPLHAQRGASITKSLPLDLSFTLSRVEPPYAVRLFFSRSQIYVNSMTRSRMQLLTFELPSGGAYVLRIVRIDPSVDYGQYAISISHPIGFTIVSRVVAILVLAFASLGSIIFTALLIAAKV